MRRRQVVVDLDDAHRAALQRDRADRLELKVCLLNLGPPKTEASFRTVPLPQVVLDELAAHVAGYEPGWGDHLFTTPSGGPIWRSTWAQTWATAVRRAGLPTGTPVPRRR
jgi:hypothetical protein